MRSLLAFQGSCLPNILQAPAGVFATSQKDFCFVFISCFLVTCRKFCFDPIPNHSLTFNMTEKHIFSVFTIYNKILMRGVFSELDYLTSQNRVIVSRSRSLFITFCPGLTLCVLNHQHLTLSVLKPCNL